jgi:hypothetical protein
VEYLRATRSCSPSGIMESEEHTVAPEGSVLHEDLRGLVVATSLTE